MVTDKNDLSGIYTVRNLKFDKRTRMANKEGAINYLIFVILEYLQPGYYFLDFRSVKRHTPTLLLSVV